MTPSPFSETDDAREIPLLDDESLEQFDEFLDSDQVDAEALGVFEAHGFLVALAIAPEPVDAAVWVSVLFNGDPAFSDEAQRQHILGLCETLQRNATLAFERGLLPELPFDPEIEGHPLDAPAGEWCAGFMEAVFLNEEAWFGNDEEQAAQLLLPFMALSGLFEEEDPDLAELAGSPRRATELSNQLAELCLDLFLLFRAPKEKKGAPSARPSSGGNGRQRGKKKKR